VCILSVTAQSLGVVSIPAGLTEKADAVKRFEELRVSIESINKAVVYHKYAFTILNKDMERHAGYNNYYNNLQRLTNIDGNLYDAAGKHLKNVKKKDISDFSVDSRITLMTDDHIKAHNFFYAGYPYTIEYEDEKIYDGIFFLPDWIPQDSNNCAVEQSRFIVETPVDYKLRYKQFNYTGDPVVVNDGKKITYSWEVKNLHAFNVEEFAPQWEEMTVSVFIAPVDFEIQGYSGKMDSWQNLGKFIATLNAGRDALPENVKKDVHSLTDNLNSTRQKTFALYDYLQKSTRYVGIQIGIGGWQPFEAAYVASKKYGDCKALSNYLKSLLKEAGIKGYYVLVNAGDEDLNGLWIDFPSPYFNHAVVCVPDGKDSIWFECTNQTIAPGYMGSFTGNRKALLIADDGGHIVNTPEYTSQDNMQVRVVKAMVDSSGKLDASSITRYSGTQQEMPHYLISHLNKDSLDEFLNDKLNLATYEVNSVNYSEKKDLIPEVTEELHITAPSYATVSGKRFFIRPNLFNKVEKLYDENATRSSFIEYPYSFYDIDSIEIKIPGGYQIESVPQNIELNSKFGSYKIEFKILKDKIIVVRAYTRSSGRFAQGEFKNFTKFSNDLFKADHSTVVLVKESK